MRFVLDHRGSTLRHIDRVVEGIILAQKVTDSPEFYHRISSKMEPFDPRFTSEDATPEAVSATLRGASIVVRVRLQKARRKVLGWTYAADPSVVYLNIRRLDRTPIDIARTLVHEWVHAVDAVSDLEFHHGNNSRNGKSESAPYWIDDLAGKLL
ncbi:MAG: hypothetical protein Q8J78_06670, partial [Moraxellaceae bacterium]|nr:hypothetical protein [Moraxellaceae bacterium]